MEVQLEQEDLEQIQLPFYDDRLGYYAPDGSGIIHATEFYQRTLDSGVAVPGGPTQFTGRPPEAWMKDCPSSIVPLIQQVREKKGCSHMTPRELYHVALFIDWPHLNYPAPTKRKRGKHQVTLRDNIGELLKKLQDDPAMTDFPKEKLTAFFKLRHVQDQIREHSISAGKRIEQMLGTLEPRMSRDVARDKCKEICGTISPGERLSWKFLSILHESLWKPSEHRKARKRVPLPSGQPAPELHVFLAEPEQPQDEPPGSGFLVTHNTDVGMMFPDIIEARAQKVSFEEMLDLVKDSEAHLRAVDEYYAWVCQWAIPLGFLWVAVVMELCKEPDMAGRVHLHASISLPIKFHEGGGASEKNLWQSINVADLCWNNRRPNIRRCSGRPKQVPKLLGGMRYYTMANKEGRVYGKANVRLFEDPWPLKHESRQQNLVQYSCSMCRRHHCF